MLRRMFAVVGLLIALGPARPGHCPGGYWVEGHYGPRGRWHPGHWRCPGVIEIE